jgi:hypothetical protein
MRFIPFFQNPLPKGIQIESRDHPSPKEKIATTPNLVAYTYQMPDHRLPPPAQHHRSFWHAAASANP